LDHLLAQPPRSVYDHIRTRAVVVQGGCMLLLPPGGGEEAWLPPGGGLEPGESLAECAAREVWEETGLRVRIGRIAFLQEWIAVAGQGPGHHYHLHVFFHAEPIGGGPPRPERPGLPVPQWVPLSRVPALPLYPAELRALALRLERGDWPATALIRGRLEPPDAPARPLQ